MPISRVIINASPLISLFASNQQNILPELFHEIISWDLGKGETSVIGYANLHPEYHVIIDDAAARRCAKTFGIKSIGTLGVLLLAKRQGIISSIKPAIKLLEEAGLWLGKDLINMVLKEAGEL